ncbi:MAG: hypothetical protein KGH99_03475 [Thaumarchaeota archaeon]|nr:hypothetical protein [Nitrososphaerota archaeon]MDE1872522.1 hypothetical protein [Nitrososphaerota archaeon]
MQRVTKKVNSEDDLTPEEIEDIKQYRQDKANGKTKTYTLEELLKELHSN